MQKNDLVSFFGLECSGPTGGARDAKYVEIFRDPKDADPHSTFSFTHVIENLQPGVSYAFRIRAFNGFGPGDYTYRVFTTRTLAPPTPRIIRISADSVTLRWSFSNSFVKRLDELRRLFKDLDNDNSGNISRDELASALSEKAATSPDLRSFLDKKAASLGLDLYHGFGPLFDAIEGNESGEISWDEFEAFFLAAGWATGSQSIGLAASVQSVRASQHSTGAGGQGQGGASRGSSSSTKSTDVTYVLERCESEFNCVYKEALKTTAGEGTVSRLDPGQSYRFRVYSINVDGVKGPPSGSIIVHTMLETPSSNFFFPYLFASF